MMLDPRKTFVPIMQSVPDAGIFAFPPLGGLHCRYERRSARAGSTSSSATSSTIFWKKIASRGAIATTLREHGLDPVRVNLSVLSSSHRSEGRTHAND